MAVATNTGWKHTPTTWMLQLRTMLQILIHSTKLGKVETNVGKTTCNMVFHFWERCLLLKRKCWFCKVGGRWEECMNWAMYRGGGTILEGNRSEILGELAPTPSFYALANGEHKMFPQQYFPVCPLNFHFAEYKVWQHLYILHACGKAFLALHAAVSLLQQGQGVRQRFILQRAFVQDEKMQRFTKN